MLGRLFGLFSHDLGIDLGTANTLIHVRGKGVLIREPSVIAIHKKTKKVLAVGEEARKMVGRTPDNISAVKPLTSGVVSDFDAAEKMLSYYIEKVHKSDAVLPKLPRPMVVMGIPSTITEVERKAVLDAALSAGARGGYVIKEPVAAAIGAGVNVLEPKGTMVVDIGGGTTEIAVISLGGTVVARSLKVAGYEFDQAIMDYVRRRWGLLIGEGTAENIKIGLTDLSVGLKDGEGNVSSIRDDKTMEIRGRDMKSGLPKEVVISSADVSEALEPVLQSMLDGIKDVIEDTPPEMVSDVFGSGLLLAGGGALLGGLPMYIGERLNLPVRVAKDPLICVARGCGMVLEDKKLEEIVR